MENYVADWLNLLVRWTHFIAGTAWIGSSLYFVWLDNHLEPPKPQDLKRGVTGTIWSVHGGGFYNAQKYLLGPKDESLSDNLHWFKWEAYATWLSGMGMLAIVYWWGANTYLIERSVMDLSVPAAIGISAASLFAGWLVYDFLSKTVNNEAALGALLFLLITAAAWGYAQVFGARAAYIHVGALIGTIMVWNVYFYVIPGQARMVDAIRAGREPDAAPGRVARQRSVHNTYFTLPVLFIMISNHYPMTYGNKCGWLVLAAIGLAGVLVRQFFVLRHFGKAPVWMPAVAVLVLVAVAGAIAPARPGGANAAKAGEVFAKVQAIVAERCAGCHAEKPSFPGIAAAPGGVMLDTPERIKLAAPRIGQQTVLTRAMPIGNLTKMTDEERAVIGAWFPAGAVVK